MHKARAFFFVCAGLLGLALLLPRPAAAAWPTDPLVNVPLCTATGDRATPPSSRTARAGPSSPGRTTAAAPATTSTPSGSRPVARSSGRPTAWPSAPPPAISRTPPSSRTARAGPSSPGRTTAAAPTTTSTPSGSRPLARSSGRPTAWPSAPPPASQRAPHHRLGRRGRGHRHLAGLPQRQRLRHLRPADLGRWHGPVDGQRRGPLHRHRRSVAPHHRLGRRGRGHRHLGGLPQRHRLRHLRPADLGRWHGPVDGQRRGPLHRHRQSVRTPPSSRTARAGPSSPGRTTAAAALRHLRPADLGRWHGPVDGRRRGPLHRHRRSGRPHHRLGRRGRGHRRLERLSQRHRYDIYAQRISAGGTVQWTADGVALCTATGNQDVPHHRLGRRGRGHRHLAGLPQRHTTTTSTPSGSRPVARSSGRPTAWPSAPPPAIRTTPPSSRTARAGPSSPGRTTAAATADIYAQRVQANGQLGGDVSERAGRSRARVRARSRAPESLAGRRADGALHARRARRLLRSNCSMWPGAASPHARWARSARAGTRSTSARAVALRPGSIWCACGRARTRE